MGRKLYSSGGRRFVYINLKKESEEWVPVRDENDKPKSQSFIQKYQERPAELEGISLSTAAMNYQPGTWKKTKRAAILQVFPRLSSKRLPLTEDFYRQQVLLHIPWRFEDVLLRNFTSWEEVYMFHKPSIQNHNVCSVADIGEEEDEFELREDEENDPVSTEEWMCISTMGANQTVEKVELGRRDLDKNHDWHRSAREYDTYGGIATIGSFIAQQKEARLPDAVQVSMPDVTFTSEQSAILDLVQAQIKNILERSDDRSSLDLPHSVIVQGKAGKGKSLVIRAITSMVQSQLGPDACLLMGPTGVSAVTIGGSTLHSRLHLNIKAREFMPLRGTASHEFALSMKNVHFVIIDEYSMIGCKMLHMIESRLREAKGTIGKDSDVDIYLFGDSAQLSPVGDSPAYSEKQNSPEHVSGKLIYNSIDASAILTVVKRQDNAVFRTVLHNVCTGNLSSNDYDILASRFDTSVTHEERQTFKNAIHLYPKRVQVDRHNKETLENMQDPCSFTPVPVALIKAKHNCVTAAEASVNDAEGLEPTLYLAEGAQIMLRANLWTEKRLVNGTVEHILYEKLALPPDDLPSLLICSFQDYKGPYLDDEKKTIPIKPLTRNWTSPSGTPCSRTTFPVSLSYACSIHKSQGLTLHKVVLNIGEKEMSPGLTYTALSRATDLNGLVLKPFSQNRLLSLNKKPYIIGRKKWIESIEEKQLKM